MVLASHPNWFLAQEARSLLTRLSRVKPFAWQMPMVGAAAVSVRAAGAIERFLAKGRRELYGMVARFLEWLQGNGRTSPPEQSQRRFALLKLRFNSVLTQFDIFADVLTQRAQHETGVWLAGLDAFAADALALPGNYYQTPPVICYLDRGHGAAIRRARTRLPGNAQNPVAVIRVPRERMVGSGIASSLVHEVGHQGAALLDLVNSLRPVLQRMELRAGTERQAWVLWGRWISEIVADFWSLARLGVAATLGLMGVVSLPPVFVFRVALDDPHPFPWIRVMLSCALGKVMFPHRQWEDLAALWESLYPPTGLDPGRHALIARLRATTQAFTSLLLSHRPATLRGASLGEVMSPVGRQPADLAALKRRWRRLPGEALSASPTLAFAVIGQARADGTITPEEESDVVGHLLNHWALKESLNPQLSCRSDGAYPALKRFRNGAREGSELHSAAQD
jgi:hypothetical protein